ncbi:hypothetical protein TWF751_004172 [Orbilia oligospora]|nr:hypothetical protein TWF751_004172 [Orbilia oligospora]
MQPNPAIDQGPGVCQVFYLAFQAEHHANPFFIPNPETANVVELGIAVRSYIFAVDVLRLATHLPSTTTFLIHVGLHDKVNDLVTPINWLASWIVFNARLMANRTMANPYVLMYCIVTSQGRHTAGRR